MPIKKNSDYSDKELLQHYYQDGDAAWLGDLLERYTMLLLGVCMKYLKDEEAAKDAVQQVFLKAISELQKYKVEYFKSWVYMIAKNYCLMQLRSKGRFTSEINDDLLAASPDEVLTKNNLIEKEYNLQKMELALQKLHADQKQCIESFYLQKKTYQHIADEFNYTIKQVKSHIQNGKRNLKILMETNDLNES